MSNQTQHGSSDGAPTFFINGVRHNGSFDFETLLGAVRPAA